VELLLQPEKMECDCDGDDDNDDDDAAAAAAAAGESSPFKTEFKIHCFPRTKNKDAMHCDAYLFDQLLADA
jgi:hypothetical protein